MTKQDERLLMDDELDMVTGGALSNSELNKMNGIVEKVDNAINGNNTTTASAGTGMSSGMQSDVQKLAL